MTTAAVVLAGGESRRFGSDKLSARVGDRSLLDHAVGGLPAGITIFLVGPVREVSRPVTVVREDPPGGGPAAGLLAGLRAALAGGADLILVLPGDAPGAGGAATTMLDLLDRDPALTAVVGVDVSGQLQPLQLGVRRSAAEQLIRLAGPDAGRGTSARGLVAQLTPAPTPVELPREHTADVDFPSDLPDLS